MGFLFIRTYVLAGPDDGIIRRLVPALLRGNTVRISSPLLTAAVWRCSVF
jgi:hypothetical protein